MLFRSAGIEVSGTVSNLRVHPDITDSVPPFASFGVYASLGLDIGGFTATATDPASLFAALTVNGGGCLRR